MITWVPWGTIMQSNVAIIKDAAPVHPRVEEAVRVSVRQELENYIVSSATKLSKWCHVH